MIRRESCVIFCLVISFFYSPLFASSGKEEAGLITYWAFDEGFGEVAKDKSGNGNDGKISGAKWVKVKRGFALSFDGVDDYVYCGNNPNLSFNESAISIELCVKPNNLKKAASVLITGAYKIRVGGGYTGYTDRVIMFLGGFDNFRYSGNGAVRKGYWTHIVYVKNGSNLDCYINGKRSNWYATTIPSSVSGSSSLTVGGQGEFNGIIAEVKIYNRALSAEEVIASYEQISLTTLREHVIRFAKICFIVAMIIFVVIMRKFWLERKEIISESLY